MEDSGSSLSELAVLSKSKKIYRNIDVSPNKDNSPIVISDLSLGSKLNK